MADADTIGALMVSANTFLTATPRNLPAADIAWPNKAFDAAGKALWAKVSLVPNSPVVATLGVGGRDRGTGFLQIDLNVPEGGGDGVFRTWENYARGFFVAGKTFTQTTDAIRVSGAGTSAINGEYVRNGSSSGAPRYTMGLYEIIEMPGFAGTWLLQRISDAVNFYFGTGGNSTGPGTATAWVTNTDNAAAPAPSVLPHPTQVARVISCGVSQGRNVDNWFRKSITVAYRSDFTRQN